MTTDAKDASHNSLWALFRRRFLSDAPRQVLGLQSSLAQNRHTRRFAKRMQAPHAGDRRSGSAPEDSSEKRNHFRLRFVKRDLLPQIQLEFSAGSADFEYMNCKRPIF